jgi:mitochondrial fission protein ELM1
MKNSVNKGETWVLVDDRPGNYSQAIGLAKEIDENYKIININYGFFKFLPNFILGASLISLDCASKKIVKKLENSATTIIAAGRRSAPIALYLKKKSHNKSRAIQIMNPDAFHEKFDAIILPEHDEIKNTSNIIISIGALTSISDEKIELQCQNFAKIFDFEGQKIALLVGGDSKNGVFDENSAKNLIKNAIKVAKNMNAKLFVLTSRRTNKKIINLLQEKLKESKCLYEFFDFFELEKDENPYLATIGFADFFIVTGDSVSMISEVCSTSKPVYIFDENQISSKKHKKFHQSLLLQNFVRKFDNKIEKLEKFSDKKLNETKRIALLIKNL